MRAFQLNAAGGTPSLIELPVPEPAKGELCLRIVSCGLNFADLLMIDGRYQERPTPPFTLGMEVAGIVDSLGPETQGPAPGTRVAVFAGHGGLAEYGCFATARCLPIPDAMSFDHAAAFQIAYGSSHLALTRRARLQPGETLLVTGAAGGVGLTAVEVGKALGARVIAVARGAEKLAVAQAAGADHLIDSDTTDLKAAVKSLGGADVVYETVGGDHFTAEQGAVCDQGWRTVACPPHERRRGPCLLRGSAEPSWRGRAQAPTRWKAWTKAKWELPLQQSRQPQRATCPGFARALWPQTGAALWSQS